MQLTAIGFAITFVFGLGNLAYVVLLLAKMVLFASWTSYRRDEGVSRAFSISVVAIGTAAAVTLGMLLALQIVPSTDRYLTPLGGMVIGNSMNTTSLVLSRIQDDVRTQRLTVEAALALGPTSRQVISPMLKPSLKSTMIPLIDSTKTARIIFLPARWRG